MGSCTTEQKCVLPSYSIPPKLTAIAANTVTRCLIYEDYKECNYYRWDPVKIWQFETPQPKKKGKKKVGDALAQTDELMFTHPPPPWRGLKEFCNWWWNNSFLGSENSPLRSYIISALEHCSWTSSSEEEDILFLLLRLCLDTQLNIGCDTNTEIPITWSNELMAILEQLSPFPLQKLTVTKDIFGNKNVISTILQGSPKLQVLRIGQWELNNDILFTLGAHCKNLQEFTIPSMKPDVFMSDTALFQCFFSGKSPKEVLLCNANNEIPKLSFQNLRYVDILYCKQMQRFIEMLCVFYPRICLSGIDLSVDNVCKNVCESFVDVGSSINTVGLGARTETILNDKLYQVSSISPHLRELRLHVDDKFPGADVDSTYQRRLEDAGKTLKALIKTIKCLDSLVLRPHEGTDITVVVLPTIAEYGKQLRSLQLLYDFSGVNTNTLYQLINQCPQLERLVVCLNIEETDNASTSFRTSLRKCPCLESLLLVDLGIDQENYDNNDNFAVVKIASDVLNAASNLQMLGLSCRESVHSQYCSLYSSSVVKLHLQFSSSEDTLAEYENDSKCISYCYYFINEFLPKFPNLKSISIEDPRSKLWFEGLENLTKKGFNFTRKSPEFFNYFKWGDGGNNNSESTFNFVVM